MAAEGNIVAEKFQIVIGKPDLNAGFVAAGLLGRAPGKDAYGGRAKAFKNIFNRAGKAVAVGEKKNDSCDAPGHSRHREQRAPEVMAHGGDGLLEQIAMHS